MNPVEADMEEYNVSHSWQYSSSPVDFSDFLHC